MRTLWNILWLRGWLSVIRWWAGLRARLDLEEATLRAEVARLAPRKPQAGQRGGVGRPGPLAGAAAAPGAAERRRAIEAKPSPEPQPHDWVAMLDEADLERLLGEGDPPPEPPGALPLPELQALRQRLHQGVRAAVARQHHRA